jgi:DNA ligase 1
VIRFARLLDDLLYSPSRNAKLALMKDYFATAPDPDRGYALAALAGTMEFRHAKPALIRALAAERVDPVLFDLSYDFVGDLAETTALIWPSARVNSDPPPLADVVNGLNTAGKSELPRLLASFLDRLDATGRWALLKLITGALRVGVSARLAKTALAEIGKIDLAQIEEAWHGLVPPYTELFTWIEGRGGPPTTADAPTFRPLMLSHPLEEKDLATMDPAEYCAEWKWDGIRVQLVAQAGRVSLYSRTGDEIGDSFPELTQDIPFDAVLDGELLVRRGETLGSFNDLQQRLNRKAVTPKMRAEYPAFIRLYDILLDGPEDLRPLPFGVRRAHLQTWIDTHPDPRFDLSPLVPFASWEDLAVKRREAAAQTSEGVMLKRVDSPYLSGRPKGHWFKWKRDPRTIDAVLMYAQRGHGKRSSFYSDFTFGCWRPAERNARELVPVGKAYFGFTDVELAALDKWVRNHTIDRHGPVRVVEPKLVIELAFDAVQKSSRHKSGLALRFPRVNRIRWDKPAHEADEVASLAALAE